MLARRRLITGEQIDERSIDEKSISADLDIDENTALDQRDEPSCCRRPGDSASIDDAGYSAVGVLEENIEHLRVQKTGQK